MPRAEPIPPEVVLLIEALDDECAYKVLKFFMGKTLKIPDKETFYKVFVGTYIYALYSVKAIDRETALRMFRKYLGQKSFPTWTSKNLYFMKLAVCLWKHKDMIEKLLQVEFDLIKEIKRKR